MSFVSVAPLVQAPNFPELEGLGRFISVLACSSPCAANSQFLRLPLSCEFLSNVTCFRLLLIFIYCHALNMICATHGRLYTCITVMVISILPPFLAAHIFSNSITISVQYIFCAIYYVLSVYHISTLIAAVILFTR